MARWVGSSARPTRPLPPRTSSASRVRSNAHDAAAASERSRHVEISVAVEGETLRPAEAAEKSADFARWMMRKTRSKLEVVGPVTKSSPVGLNAR